MTSLSEMKIEEIKIEAKDEKELPVDYVVLKPEVKQQDMKGQSTLQDFFGRSFAAKHVKKEDLLDKLQQKRGRGRPSHDEVALAQARAKGEELVVTTLQHWQKLNEEVKPKDTEGSNYGGRPAVPKFLKKVDVLQSSNRKVPGAKAKRVEESAATKLIMCEVMKKNMKVFSSPKEFKQKMEELYSKPWDTLSKILAGEELWKQRVKKLKLGKGTLGTLAAKGTCSKGKKNKAARGCRNAGAGRKDVFKHVKVRLKSWLERERSMCHHVDKVDLVEEFLDMLKDDIEDVQRELKRRKTNTAALQSTSSNHQHVEGGDQVVEALEADKLDLQFFDEKGLQAYEKEVENRCQRLKNSKKYFEAFGDRLLHDLGAKLLKPGRLSALSMKEEEIRVKSSWRDFDAVLWIAAFGDEAEVSKFVASPVEFQNCRQNLVIGFSDQIPVWVKIGRSKQVYCEREVQKRKTSKDFKALQDKALLAIKNKAEAAEKKTSEEAEVSVDLDQIVVVDPNQGLDTEGLEQEAEQTVEAGFFLALCQFLIIVGGFSFWGGSAQNPGLPGTPLENMIFAIL